jgi:hypothetical protein
MALSVEEVEKLRAAGFSDQDIVDYEKSQSAAPGAPAPVDPSAPVAELSETAIPATAPPPESTFTETMLGALPGVKEGLITGAELYGLVKAPGLISRGFEAWKESSKAKLAAAESAKIAEEGRQARFSAKAENDLLKADEMRMKNDELRAKNEATRQARVPQAERPVIFRQQPPSVTPGPGGQVPVQGPPNANNYMQRMNNLASQYGQAQTVVQQQAPAARPAPAPAQPSGGMTYRPIQGGGGMRGGGGGGGGGGGMGPFDPNKRWRPMQY